ncbi:MAG TPA: hypothetical protein VEM76_14010 [Anaeromyxobacteraceae bacterium]|nr:hypothetical protein [Anaeromyxobacteraceae bacterium]
MKLAARLLLLAGGLGIALLFFRAGPREVTLVYGVPDDRVRAVEVVIAHGGEVLRRAELRVAGDRTPSHRVRLPDGDYLLRIELLGEGPPRHLEKSITVAESGTLVIPLGP